MRLTSEIFVSALLRRVFSSGGFAAVLRKGAAEAGAVFVLVRTRGDQPRLYCPAPQSGYSSASPSGRMFVLAPAGDENELEKRLEREARFDPDLWLVELELRGNEERELLEIVDPAA